MSAVAVLDLRRDAALRRIGGGATSAGLTLAQLKEVRGVTRIVAVTLSRLVKTTQLPGVEVVTVPTELAEAGNGQLDRWLFAKGPAVGATTLLVTPGTTPLLPSAKYEACIRAVGKTYASAIVVRPVTVMINGKTIKANTPVTGTRVFKPVSASHECRLVSVSLLESLDVSEHDQYVLVDALVQANKI